MTVDCSEILVSREIPAILRDVHFDVMKILRKYKKISLRITSKLFQDLIGARKVSNLEIRGLQYYKVCPGFESIAFHIGTFIGGF